MKKYLSSIVLRGALWGLTEATLGYVLHSFSLNVGWVLWFPLAFFFIDSVYRKTKSSYSIIFTSFLAASIKLVDFIMPTSPDRIINPAISIILEGLAVFALYKIAERRRDTCNNAGYSYGCDHGSNQCCDSSRDSGRGPARPGYAGVLFASAGWRLLYILYMLLMPESYAGISPLRSGSALLSFFGVECVVNSLMIFGFTKIAELAGEKAKQTVLQLAGGFVKRLKLHGISGSTLEAAFSCLMLAAALLAQWKL